MNTAFHILVSYTASCPHLLTWQSEQKGHLLPPDHVLAPVDAGHPHQEQNFTSRVMCIALGLDERISPSKGW